VGWPPPRPSHLPPVGGALDYQLGAAYPPAAQVSIVARDSTAAPPVNGYAICYVNAFQTQPGELGAWPDEVLLRSTDGSPVALRRKDAMTVARRLVSIAHDAGLAAAQKNAAEDAALLRTAGFDFAIAEECAAYSECASYISVYGDHVLDIEYTDNLPRTFAEMCADPSTPRSVVLRERDLVAPSEPSYHFQLCP
jgi:hypothetical protein